MNKYKKYYKYVKQYQYNFEKLLKFLKTNTHTYNNLKIANEALQYAVFNNTGYFTSSVLEMFYVNYGKQLKCDINDIKYKPNTVLHVMTTGYNKGGHTRVVERWIGTAAKDQIQSVVMLIPNEENLTTLKENIQKQNGEYIVFDNNLTLEERAIKLRKLAMNYEYIVLHTHMDDPTAVIAFGTEDFTRPVLFYNHASHLFWLGKSITDLFLDLTQDDMITKGKRNIKNIYTLGVPYKEININTQDNDKENLRKKLKLPLNKKIVITSGAPCRYPVIANENFIDYLKEIIDDDTYCYAIGIPPQTKEWRLAKIETKGHIIPIGSIDFKAGYLDYIKAADLYLDSYPVGGGTAVIDALSVGTPVLSLHSVAKQFDYLTITSAYCKSSKDFIDKAKNILNNKQYANEILSEVQESLIKYQSLDVWKNKIKHIFDIVPKKHTVQNLSNEIDNSKIIDLSVLDNFMLNKKFLKKTRLFSNNDIKNYIKYGKCYKSVGIHNLLEICKFKDQDIHKKYTVLTIFYITFKIYEQNY